MWGEESAILGANGWVHHICCGVHIQDLKRFQLTKVCFHPGSVAVNFAWGFVQNSITVFWGLFWKLRCAHICNKNAPLVIQLGSRDSHAGDATGITGTSPWTKSSLNGRIVIWTADSGNPRCSTCDSMANNKSAPKKGSPDVFHNHHHHHHHHH